MTTEIKRHCDSIQRRVEFDNLQAKNQTTRPRDEATHSPLPWETYQEGHNAAGWPIWTIFTPESALAKIYTFGEGENPGRAEANAAYIIKACNEYPKLLEALKAARAILAPIVHKMNVRDHFSEKNILANVIDKAIANAEKSNG